MPTVAVVLGTRPEIVKLAGVIDGLGSSAVIAHTGQHYDHELSEIFLRSLGLPHPAHRLDVGGSTRGEQIGRATAGLSALLDELQPAAVVVQGDTNSALAGALAANATGTPLVHVEAGLRSFDRAMPEEHNRVLIDHLADLLAAPTPTAVANLAREGIDGDRVICCGNTVIEAVHRQLPPAERRPRILERHGVTPAEYVLTTLHRPENTDRRDVLERVLAELATLPVPVVFPMHPRTAAAARRWGLNSLLGQLRVTPPLDGAEFLALAAEAAVLVSDSGGIQEEVTVLGRPLVVVRRSTERPESLENFATLVSPDQIAATTRTYLAQLPELHGRLGRLPSPYGDGTASQLIVRETLRRFVG
jgi:UDP-N-acetylglucosamine 2-epimerase (non-hydrolysing)